MARIDPFDSIGDSVKIPAPSPAMEKWLEKNAARHSEDCSEYVDPADNAANESEAQTHARLLKRLRDHMSLSAASRMTSPQPCASQWNSASTSRQSKLLANTIVVTEVQALAAGTVAIRTAVQIFIPMTVTGADMQFRVIWEIDIDAEGPKEAAREARAIQLTPGMSATVFDVWAYVTRKMHRIDLVEETDRLDRDELFALRAGLRFLQCDPETSPGVQELATMLLIFLDRDNKMFKRVDRGPSR